MNLKLMLFCLFLLNIEAFNINEMSEDELNENLSLNNFNKEYDSLIIMDDEESAEPIKTHEVEKRSSKNVKKRHSSIRKQEEKIKKQKAHEIEKRSSASLRKYESLSRKEEKENIKTHDIVKRSPQIPNLKPSFIFFPGRRLSIIIVRRRNSTSTGKAPGKKPGGGGGEEAPPEEAPAEE